MLGWFKKKPASSAMKSLTSEQLIAICDRFWVPRSIEYAEFVPAFNELHTRGPEIRDWSRQLLSHSDYWAREAGASLLGQLGGRGQLGDAVEIVVAELGALIHRPIEEDGKELQVVDVAMVALVEIGHPAGIPFLRSVLLSEDEWLVGDSQWTAAESLGQLCGEQFMETSDPVDAAREWLRTNPC